MSSLSVNMHNNGAIIEGSLIITYITVAYKLFLFLS